MIEIKDVHKHFDLIPALKGVSATISEGEVFGLVGSNGAGKSTLLRIMAGIIKPEKGVVFLDGQPVYENPEAKCRLFFDSDEMYYFPNATPLDMMEYYAIVYPDFDKKRFQELMDKFGLDAKRRIATFSKGMRRQTSVLLGLCANTKYMFCDETFDGLDPVMRQAVKSIIASEIISREFTPVIASHNLRELEDICDHVGLLHEGGILFSRDLQDIKTEIHKLQCVIPNLSDETRILKALNVVNQRKTGSLLTLTVRGQRDEILTCVEQTNPLFCELLPLTLEEIFINETEVAGYDIKHLIF